MYGLWRPRVLGAWRVPSAGPVILAVNHSHMIDGPMLMGTAPRPVHFLIKKEAFVGPLDPFLKGIGQLKVDRDTTDRAAVTDALGVLKAAASSGSSPRAPAARATSPRSAPASPTSPSAAAPRSSRWPSSAAPTGRAAWSRPCRRCAPGSTSSSATRSRRATAPAAAPARRSTRRPSASRANCGRTCNTQGV
ncbi:1-acyl-sn-glycerol-3-phosphate acyltransferase [Actinomadura keratinilytica]